MCISRVVQDLIVTLENPVSMHNNCASIHNTAFTLGLSLPLSIVHAYNVMRAAL